MYLIRLIKFKNSYLCKKLVIYLKQFFIIVVITCSPPPDLNLTLLPRFDLDPNRVLDLVLETWQNYTEKSDFFIELVKLFPKQEDTLCSMLGYTFAHYEVSTVFYPRY